MKLYAAIRIGEGKENRGKVCDDRILVNGVILKDGYYETEINQDTWVVAVTDGVGGSGCGWKAAEVALGEISQWDCETHLHMEELRNQFAYVDDSVRMVATTSEEYAGTKATASILMKNKDGIFVFHVGDSRIYQLTNAQGYSFMEQLTEDHNVLRRWRKKEEAKGNDLSDEELKQEYGESQWNHITSFVGMSARESFMKEMCVEKCGNPDGIYVLTSDGIHDFVSPRELKWALESNKDWKEKLKEIMTTARENGSHDDQSIIVVELE